MKVRIDFTYVTAKGTKGRFVSEEMPDSNALLLALDMEKTGRAKTLKFIDKNDSIWTIKELKKYLEGIQSEPHDVTVYFDGGFDNGKRISGLGCVIYYEQNGNRYRLRKNAQVEELETNNEAEYAAFYLAVQELEALGIHHMPVTFIGDSKVVINQLNGDWPCYEKELEKWIGRIETKLKSLGMDPEFHQVSRNDNKEADHLATQALQGIDIISTIQLNK
ncbi:reverse transcriptase-like protein [Oceanobacillus piezotolerans]|uniref:Reverse transcriptase-like protein n=1 Tax=Oceanobacillus piezotolerans TaxID=2448030 RepID=A0A498DS09_9BACI|nr:ribonuclease H family protein [Oceanobacillus piezotolerans]RLL47767.1 reverse transcriptase-like protein [Oceanobacillus piezotolerans]